MPSSPALEAEYATCPGSPPRAAPEEITTILPQRRSRIPGRHAWIARNAPVRLTPMSPDHCSSVIRCAGAIVSVIAALETQMSMPDRSGMGSETRSIRMSHPSERSSVVTSRSSSRSLAAIAAPMPPAAPVTSACRGLAVPFI